VVPYNQSRLAKGVLILNFRQALLGYNIISATNRIFEGYLVLVWVYSDLPTMEYLEILSTLLSDLVNASAGIGGITLTGIGSLPSQASPKILGLNSCRHPHAISGIALPILRI
jgi:hypothetical protein